MKTKRSIDPFDPAKLALALASVELDSARSSYPEMRSLHEQPWPFVSWWTYAR